MARLLVHVEGQTEEGFVNEVLKGYLEKIVGYESVRPKLIGNARKRQNRGGICAWSAARGDICRHLREDRGAIATTMVDYYALPKTGDKAWPGRAEATNLPHAQKAKTIEAALSADLCHHMGESFDPQRFVPFVVMHEFEGLLFSDCPAFGRGIYEEHLIPKLQEIRDAFASPEEIDDSPETAPSKRILDFMPTYQKRLLGVLASIEIGLESIRNACPHFDEWLRELEVLGGYPGADYSA